MGEKLSYLDFAEEDYQFLMNCKKHGQFGNAMCMLSQKTCERYLKHLIENECKNVDISYILKTHSLRNLRKHIKEFIPEFKCDWDVLLKADGFYFTASYPGDDAYFASREDTEECMLAVGEARLAVKRFYTEIESILTQIENAAEEVDKRMK